MILERRTILVRDQRDCLSSDIRRWAFDVGRSMFASKVRLSSGCRPSDQVWRLASGVRCLSSGCRPSDQGCRPSSVVRRLASGFTLIEVLVAMTVLAVMVLMVANIFQSSSAAWNIGTQKSDMNTAARAALDYMARELASAVAGPIDKAGSIGAQYLTFRYEETDDIRFLALANDPNVSGNERAIRGVFFWLNSVDAVKYSLRTGRKVDTSGTEPLDCYSLAWPVWYALHPTSHSVMISNVLSLNFYVYKNEADLIAGDYIPDIGISPIAILNELPLCVDIALTLLSDDDMRRYNQLTVPADKTAFSDRNAKLYSTRVYFPNRKGYGAR